MRERGQSQMSHGSTIKNYIDVVKEVLTGKTYPQCAEKFNLSIAQVSSAIRCGIKHLKDYTGLEMRESSHYQHFMEKKEEIQKHLKKPYPKVKIVRDAADYLRKEFGEGFAGYPEKVAAEWETIRGTFRSVRKTRETVSIQRWLASEGYLVGDMATEGMLNFAFETFKKTLLQVNAQDESYLFKIKKAQRDGMGNRMIIEAEIGEGKHTAERRFLINLSMY